MHFVVHLIHASHTDHRCLSSSYPHRPVPRLESELGPPSAVRLQYGVGTRDVSTPLYSPFPIFSWPSTSPPIAINMENGHCGKLYPGTIVPSPVGLGDPCQSDKGRRLSRLDRDTH